MKSFQKKKKKKYQHSFHFIFLHFIIHMSAFYTNRTRYQTETKKACLQNRKYQTFASIPKNGAPDSLEEWSARAPESDNYENKENDDLIKKNENPLCATEDDGEEHNETAEDGQSKSELLKSPMESPIRAPSEEEDDDDISDEKWVRIIREANELIYGKDTKWFEEEEDSKNSNNNNSNSSNWKEEARKKIEGRSYLELKKNPPNTVEFAGMSIELNNLNKYTVKELYDISEALRDNDMLLYRLYFKRIHTLIYAKENDVSYEDAEDMVELDYSDFEEFEIFNDYNDL